MTTLAALLLASFTAAAPSDGLPPHVRNAQVSRQDASQGLETIYRTLAGQAGPLWIGYAMPVLGDQQILLPRVRARHLPGLLRVPPGT